jgi:hypothetical protein
MEAQNPQTVISNTCTKIFNLPYVAGFGGLAPEQLSLFFWNVTLQHWINGAR